ncbi:biotin/lipoyl-binding protein [Hoylesella shahii]|uniref:biotin/lipoyl-binding protein n=1 Tax=Hoylesella shahii TaxID=228603 RepID=UPI000B195CCA|nr:biotin/lipoyl-binding protein [Hoylesella shahii]
MQKKRQLKLKLWIGGAFIIALAAIAAIIANSLKTPKVQMIDGQVEVLQYSVQVQQKGKVLEIRVKEGDYVEVGDTLASIEPTIHPSPKTPHSKF